MTGRTQEGPNRWVLFGFLTTAGILGLVDRQIISVLKPMISAELRWTDAQYGLLGSAFQGATALSLLVAGPIADRLGVRRANAVGVFAWSLSALAHAVAATLGQFAACRVALGATEALGIPTTIKTVAAIFPPHLRSLGFGLSNGVASVSGIAAPIIIPLAALAVGWRGAYVAAGLLGVAWAGLWVLATRRVQFGDHPGAPTAAAAPITTIFGDRATWLIAVAKLLSDATWFLMLFWMPDMMHRLYGLVGVPVGGPLAVAYAGAALGSVLSGGVASALISRGMTVNVVRKSLMLASALVVLCLPAALAAPNAWIAALVLAVVLAAHQGFSTNLFALITDITPRAKIGRVTGFAAFFGNIGGMVVSAAAGAALTAGIGYLALLVATSLTYLLALGWIQLLMPVIRPVESGPEGSDAGAAPRAIAS